MKLALGTAQFGGAYGTFNTHGQLTEDEAAACLELAEASDIDTIDTAQAYGSEGILGRLGAAARFRIVTKVSKLGEMPASGVRHRVEASLKALRAERIHGLMMHDASDLAGDRGQLVWRELERLIQEGLVGEIGVSVYTPQEAMSLASRFPIGIIQAPFSVFDQRMRASGAFARLRALHVEIHVRSVFLQGFALSDPAALPRHLAPYRDVLETYRTTAARHGLTPLALALAAVRADETIDRVVVGVNGHAHFKEIVDAWRNDPGMVDVADCAVNDLRLVNPATWGANE